MILKLIKNLSPKDYVPKDLTVLLTLEGTLRAGTSLLYPSITLEIPDIVYNNIGYMDNDNFNEILDAGYMDDFLDDLLSCNYAYIEDFKRYYYITNIISDTNKLWTIQLEYDELESFKDEYLKLNAYITRNEFLYNVFVKDDRVSYFYDKDISEEVMPYGAYVDTYFHPNFVNNPDITNYVITVITKDTTDDVQHIPADIITTNILDETVDSIVSGVRSTSRSYATNVKRIKNLADICISHPDNATFFLSCLAYPFEVKTSGDWKNFSYGTYSGLVPIVKDLLCEVPDILIIADFTITGNSFLDYEPFTTYELWLPYLAWVRVNADDILNKRILVYYVVDYRTGSAQVNICNLTDNKIIYTSTCQLGVRIPFNTTNLQSIEEAKTNNNLNLILGSISNGIGMINNTASGNYSGVAQGFLNIAGSVLKWTNNNNQMHVSASGSVSTNNGGLYLPQDVRVRKTRLKPKGYDANYFHLNGRPLNQYTNLENLRGYTEVGEINLENIVNATKPELDKLEATLKNGIVINKE